MKHSYSTGVCQSGKGRGTTLPPPPPPPVLVGATGTVTVASGTVTVHLTAPARAALYDGGHANGPGWFSRPLATLSAGPSQLVPPALTGGTSLGSSVGFSPAAWLCLDTAASVIFDLESNAGGSFAVLAGYNDVSYATAPNLTITAAHQGASLRIVESATDPHGAATATSANLVIPAALPPQATAGTLSAVQYSQGIGTIDRDIAAGFTIPSGITPTFSIVSAPTGYSIASGSVRRVSTDTASTATITIRLTDQYGRTTDVTEAVTLLAYSVTLSGSMASVTYGSNDPSTTAYSGTFAGGAYDGVAWSFTNANLTGLPNGRAYWIVPPAAPVFVTDANANGLLNAGDVIAPGRAGIAAYPAGNTPPTITRSLRDAAGTVLAASFSGNYTATGSEAGGGVLTRESDGVTLSDSPQIGVQTGLYTFTDTFNRANAALDPEANWVQSINTNSGNAVISGNRATLSIGNCLAAVEYVGTPTPPANQKATLVGVALVANSANYRARVLVRGGGTFQNHYAFEVYANGTWLLYKRVAGTNTTLAGNSTSALRLDGTDLISLQVTGTAPAVLVAKVNSTTVTTQNDSTSPHVSGSAGFLLYSGDASLKPSVDQFEIAQV